MTSHVVGGEAAGRRLDVYLAEATGTARSAITRLIKADLVRVNGRDARASYQVAPGDHIDVLEAPQPEPDAHVLQLPVLYQDDDVVIVDKPAGLSVHPGNGRKDEATVATFARTISADPDPDRPGIVHRLDRDTSGILVLARSVASKAFLQAEWQSHNVKKTYQALLVGSLRPSSGIIDLPTGRDPVNPTRRKVLGGGRPSLTRYQVLEDLAGYTLVEAYPETGRTHQLRVHFAAMRHPIAGDTTYSDPKRPLGLRRQFLHASRLELPLPSGQTISVESPLPQDIKAILDKLHRDI